MNSSIDMINQMYAGAALHDEGGSITDDGVAYNKRVPDLQTMSRSNSKASKLG